MFSELLGIPAIQIALLAVGAISSLWTLYLTLSRKNMACRFLRDIIQKQNSGSKVIHKNMSTVQVWQERPGTAPNNLVLTVKINLFLRPSVFHKDKKIIYRDVKVRCSEQGPVESLFRDVKEMADMRQ